MVCAQVAATPLHASTVCEPAAQLGAPHVTLAASTVQVPLVFAPFATEHT
jgi:hypothetical protein